MTTQYIEGSEYIGDFTNYTPASDFELDLDEQLDSVKDEFTPEELRHLRNKMLIEHNQIQSPVRVYRENPLYIRFHDNSVIREMTYEDTVEVESYDETLTGCFEYIGTWYCSGFANSVQEAMQALASFVEPYFEQ